MLLEYTIDSNEDEIFPSSVELRRRIAGRKTQASLDSRGMDEHDLIKLKEMNKSELQQHGEEVLTLTMTEVNSKVALVRIDQQLKVESKLRSLDKDVARASRLSKTRLDTLEDLERRILQMRQELHKPGVRTVQEDIDYEKNLNNKAR